MCPGLNVSNLLQITKAFSLKTRVTTVFLNTFSLHFIKDTHLHLHGNHLHMNYSYIFTLALAI